MKPVLVDTSVWRRFFAGNPAVRTLGDLLDEDGAVLVHPFVVGELVMGGLSSRQEELFARLPTAFVLPQEEVINLVRHRRLARRGIGWIDAHLLASALASSALLWSADKALAAIASEAKLDLRSNAHKIAPLRPQSASSQCHSKKRTAAVRRSAGTFRALQ